ncbi:MAG TPA: Ldh family oxidoreductase [Rubrivivax sp.]|nr:Ldh family oxidoreductase [Rubrivivax sp.]
MAPHFTEAELLAAVTGLLARHGVEPVSAGAVAQSIVAAERDGAFSHGLARLPAYLSTLKSGWLAPATAMVVEDAAPAVLRVDARNGFAQGALARAGDHAISKARSQGLCSIAIHDSHHFGCLWPDVEPFAREGLLCLAFVHSRSRLVAPGAKQRVLGTNPMAFACPRPGGEPLVWDQASSVMAHGDVLLAARDGHPLPEGVGVDREGRATHVAAEIVDGGALLPFAGHKGFLIALMVEIMAGALTGSRFGFEDGSGAFPGAQTSNAGQTLLLIDPQRSAGADFGARVETLLAVLQAAGTERLPADRRYRNRRLAAERGIPVNADTMALLQRG